MSTPQSNLGISPTVSSGTSSLTFLRRLLCRFAKGAFEAKALRKSGLAALQQWKLKVDSKLCNCCNIC